MPALLVMAMLTAEPAKPEDVALAMIDDLKNGRADAAHARLGPTSSALPAQTLLAAWQQAADGLGAIGRIERVNSAEQKGLIVFAHAVHFAKGTLQVTTAVDPKTLKAEGFWLKPMADASSAAYVKADAFTSSEVALGKEPWALTGTVTVPVGKGPFPAVVLVHGSGPHDRDETIGANKPFRDLAEGLSPRGVIALPSAKRALATGENKTRGVNVVDEV